MLRVTDPRFTGFNEFGNEHMPDDPVFQTVDRVFKVVPKVLEEYSAERVKAGKNPIANPWPNVDAGSGCLLNHYGLSEFSYYTVLFSVSRAMGMLSQLIWNRAVGHRHYPSEVGRFEVHPNLEEVERTVGTDVSHFARGRLRRCRPRFVFEGRA